MARAHPRDFALHAAGRLVRTLAGSQTDVLVGLATPFSQALRQRRVGTLALKGTLLALHTGLALLGLAGLWRRRRAPLWALLGFFVGSKLAVHAIVFGSPRYAVPLYPLLLLGACALFSPPAASSGAIDAPDPAGVVG